MKKNKSIVTLIAFVLIVVTFVLALLVDSLGSLITSITTTIITVIGSLVIWMQFKRDGELAAIDIVTQLNKLFLKSEGLMCLRNKLMRTSDSKEFSDQGILKGKDITKFEDSYIKDDNLNLIEYLEFFENMAVMVFDDVLKIENVDHIFGDSFFYALNNTFIQNSEIIPYVQHYHKIIVLHKEWTKYREKKGISIPYHDTCLSKNLKEYDEIRAD